MPSLASRLSALKSRARQAIRGAGLSQLLAQTGRGAASIGRATQTQLRKVATSALGKSLLKGLLKQPGKRTGSISREREIAAAADFLRGAGYDVISPEQREKRKPVAFEWGDEAGQPFPERTTHDRPAPGRESEFESAENKTGEISNDVQMIRVKSSNVHSIGFRLETQNAGTLFIRFLGQVGKRRAGPGALYEYYEVPESLWSAFEKASSFGKFVWDEIRVRGTVSGHRYSYEFVGTGPRGYIPRRATLMRGKPGEFYLRRQFKGRSSGLANQKVRQSGPNPGRGPGAKHLILKRGRKGKRE